MEDDLPGYLELGNTSPQDVNSLKPTFCHRSCPFHCGMHKIRPFPGIHRAWTLVFLLGKNGAAQLFIQVQKVQFATYSIYLRRIEAEIGGS